MAEDFPGATMGFSFTADTIGAVADPYEDSFSTECDYVKWQSSQTACQALNHLIMTSANEPRLKVRLKEDELGIGTDSRGAFRAFFISFYYSLDLMFFICYVIGLGWQRQPSFDQIPEFSLLSTNDGPSTSFGTSSKPSSSSSSSKPSSRPPRSRPRPSGTKSRPSTKPISTNLEDSSAPPLSKTNPEQLLDVIKGMKTHADQKAGVVHPRRNSTAGSVASSSSFTRVGRTSMANTVAAAATTMATRKRARHASDGRNSSSDGASHGQAKRGRVVLDKGKARASVEGLEMQKAKEMAKEKAKEAHIPPSRAASGSGTASSSSGSGSRKPEGTSDTSISMEVDEGDLSLAADRSTRSWTTESPSLLGSSSSLSSAESRSPSQKRMPPPPVPLAAKLLAAKANGHLSQRRSGAALGASTRASTPSLVLIPTQKETNLNVDSKMVPKLHPLLQNPPTKPSAPIISHSNSNLYPLGRQTKVNPLPHQAPSRARAQPGSRQNHNPAVPSDIPPRVAITVPTSDATATTKVKTEQSFAKPVQAQPQAPLPQAQPLRSTTSCKPLSGGTSTTRTSSAATTLAAARTAATNLPSTLQGATRSQPQHLTLSQSTRPPPLGMRRTNTFPAGGMGSGIGQKTGALPTKQKGFRVPFMNGGMGSQQHQQQQQQQPSVADSGASKQGGAGAATSNAPSNSKSNLASGSTASFSSAKSKADEQPSAQTISAPAPPPPATAAVPAIELPGPTDGDADSSFDMSLSFDMDALEETMRLYD